MKSGEKRKCSFDTKLQSYDQFGQTFSMLIDDSRSALPSRVGAICSLVLLVVMIVFTGYKIDILTSKRKIDIIQAVKEFHFDDSHVFGAEQGLNIAVGLLDSFNPVSKQILDPSYGKIEFFKFQWEFNENGEFGV